MKKILLFLLFFSPFFIFSITLAQQGYQPLVGQIPGLTETTGSGNLGTWLNGVYMFLIGVAGALAIVMIFWAGFQFVVSGDNAGKRSEAKNRILAALGGLLLALASFLILNTINPQLVNINLGFNKVTPPQTQTNTPGGIAGQAGAGVGAAMGAGGIVSGANSSFFGTVGVDPYFVRHDDYNNPLWNVLYGNGQIRPPQTGSTPGSSSGFPNTSNPNNSNTTPTDITGDKSESAVREYFRVHGIAINNSPCSGGQTSGCTNVQGLGDRAMTGLVYIKSRSGASVTITGGTEPGHATHGIGKSIVDLRLNPTLDTWITSNATRNYKRGSWTEYAHADGTTFMHEGDHWHVEFH